MGWQFGSCLHEPVHFSSLFMCTYFVLGAMLNYKGTALQLHDPQPQRAYDLAHHFVAQAYPNTYSSDTYSAISHSQQALRNTLRVVAIKHTEGGRESFHIAGELGKICKV